MQNLPTSNHQTTDNEATDSQLAHSDPPGIPFPQSSHATQGEVDGAYEHDRAGRRTEVKNAGEINYGTRSKSRAPKSRAQSKARGEPREPSRVRNENGGTEVTVRRAEGNSTHANYERDTRMDTGVEVNPEDGPQLAMGREVSARTAKDGKSLETSPNARQSSKRTQQVRPTDHPRLRSGDAERYYTKYQNYKERSNDLAEEVEQLTDANQSLSIRYQEKSQRVDALEEYINNEIVNLNRDRSAMHHKILELEGELRRERSRAAKLTADLEQTRELAETRRLELKGSENFLTKADALAASDIKGMVESLNDEIYQVSASMTEEVITKEPATREEFDNAFARVSSAMGSGLAKLLASQLGDDESFVLQFTFQAAMTHQIKEMTWCWQFDNNAAHNHMNQLYKFIRAKEDQAVAGRWRSLTRSQIHILRYDNTDINLSLAKRVLLFLADLMVVAGYSDKCAIEHVKKFKKNIQRVIEATLSLNKTFGEEFTSADLDVHYVSHGEAFDPNYMEDANETPKNKSGRAVGQVLCMSSFGLIQSEGRPKPKQVLLLKPKVVLDSIVKDLLSQQADNTPEDIEGRSSFEKTEALLATSVPLPEDNDEFHTADERSEDAEMVSGGLRQEGREGDGLREHEEEKAGEVGTDGDTEISEDYELVSGSEGEGSDGKLESNQKESLQEGGTGVGQQHANVSDSSGIETEAKRMEPSAVSENTPSVSPAGPHDAEVPASNAAPNQVEPRTAQHPGEAPDATQAAQHGSGVANSEVQSDGAKLSSPAETQAVSPNSSPAAEITAGSAETISDPATTPNPRSVPTTQPVLNKDLSEEEVDLREEVDSKLDAEPQGVSMDVEIQKPSNVDEVIGGGQASGVGGRLPNVPIPSAPQDEDSEMKDASVTISPEAESKVDPETRGASMDVEPQEPGNTDKAIPSGQTIGADGQLVGAGVPNTLLNEDAEMKDELVG